MGRKKSSQCCQLSLPRCLPSWAWCLTVCRLARMASSGGNRLCSCLRPFPGHSSTQPPGEGQTEGHPSAGGRNELLGWVGAVTGHCFLFQRKQHPSSSTACSYQLPYPYLLPGSPLIGYLLLSVISSQPHLSLTCMPVIQAIPFTECPARL